MCSGGDITKADLYEYGLSGGENAAASRAKMKEYLGLPMNMTANSMVEVLNCLMTKEKFIALCQKLFSDEGGEVIA